MPQVFLPPQLRDLAPGEAPLRVEGGTVRAVIEALDERLPGVKTRLVGDDGKLLPGLSVSVNGAIAPLALRQPITADDEVHFLPALGGG